MQVSWGRVGTQAFLIQLQMVHHSPVSGPVYDEARWVRVS